MKTETKAPEKRKKSTTPVVVNALNAFISVLKDPAVKECISVSLAYQKEQAAKKSFAGRADSVLSVFTDPRAIMATEAVIRITGETLAKRRKR